MAYARVGIIQEGNKETLVNMKYGMVKHNGKDYVFDNKKSYKIGDRSVCFFNSEKTEPVTLPQKDKIIITTTKNYSTKLKEFFGRVDL